MLKNTDFSTLSHEELIARLVAAQTRADVEAKRADAEAKRADAEAKRANAETKRANQLADQLEAAKLENNWLHGKENFINETGKTLQPLSQKFGVELYDGDRYCSARILNFIQDIVNKSLKLADTRRDVLQYFITGNEKLKRKKSRKQPSVINETVQVVASLVGGVSRGLSKINHILDNKAIKSDSNNLSGNMLEQIRQHSPELVETEPYKAKSAGRQLSKAELDESLRDYRAKTDVACPKCGTTMIDIGEQMAKLRVQFNQADKLIEEQKQHFTLLQCPKCSTVQSSLPMDAKVPLVPNRTLGQDIVLWTGFMVYNGIPIHRVEEILYAQMKLGSDALNREVIDFCEIYGKPLLARIQARANLEPIKIVDETPFDCLQNQGLGICQKTENTKSQSYVLALSSPETSRFKFTIYHAMRGRSTQDVRQAFGDDFGCEVLVSDGYGAYPAILKKDMPQAMHQTCLVHFRRELIKACNREEINRLLDRASAKVAEDKVQEWLDNDNPKLLCCLALKAIGRVYAYESQLVKRSDETDDAFFKRVHIHRQLHAKPLMDVVDAIMNKLSEGRAKENSSGTWVKVQETPETAAVVYYLNRRDSLRHFLNDGRVPPDSSLVERSIRPLTILRKNSYWMQSIKGIEAICTLYSLMATAELNGIEKPDQWLAAYGCALYHHCFNRAWTEEMASGKNPDKKIMSWDMQALSKDFDFEAFMPDRWKETDN